MAQAKGGEHVRMLLSMEKLSGLDGQGSDGVHDLATNGQMSRSALGFQFFRGKLNGITHGEGDGTESQLAAVNGQAVIRALDANRLYGDSGQLAQNQSNTGHGIVDLIIGAARTLRENQQAVAVAYRPDNLEDAGGVGIILIHGDGVGERHELFHERRVKKSLARQEINRIVVECTDQRRIKEALMICHHNAGAFFYQLFLMENLEREECIQCTTEHRASDVINRVGFVKWYGHGE